MNDPTQPVWRTVESIDIVGATPAGTFVQPEGQGKPNAIGSTEEAIYADAALIAGAMMGELSDDADYDRAAAALLRLRGLALAAHVVAEAERIRITAAIRRRAANRRAQMPACEFGGGHIDALTAKASECEAIADWLAGGGR
jgi:hypothetical protein